MDGKFRSGQEDRETVFLSGAGACRLRSSPGTPHAAWFRRVTQLTSLVYSTSMNCGRRLTCTESNKGRKKEQQQIKPPVPL